MFLVWASQANDRASGKGQGELSMNANAADDIERWDQCALAMQRHSDYCRRLADEYATAEEWEAAAYHAAASDIYGRAAAVSKALMRRAEKEQSETLVIE
jgi:hypothetical protein